MNTGYKLYTVQSQSHKIEYLGKTTNLKSHVNRFHPEMLMPATAKGAQLHQGTMWHCSIYHPAEKGRRINPICGSFHSNLPSFSAMENPGYSSLLKMLELQYKLLSHTHFTGKYSCTCTFQVMASTSTVSWEAITCYSWTSLTVSFLHCRWYSHYKKETLSNQSMWINSAKQCLWCMAHSESALCQY